MTKVLCLMACLYFSLSIFAQASNKSFTVKYITEGITADGILDEPIWENADGARDFWEYFPVDNIQAKQQSEIKMLFDDANLYVGITVKTAGRDYAIQSLKRDFRAGGADNITLLFDTFNDGTNAFLFGTNPYGVRREGLLSGGGNDRNDFSFTWDVKWKGEAKIYDKYYTAEFIIPLTSFKFKEGETKWRFNSYRFDVQSNETSTWMQIPQNQNVFGMAFMGDMIFEKPLGKSRTPLAIIPYVNAISRKDFEDDTSLNNFKTGGDAKVSIGNSMNLDITVNPDFSQVEVDDQVTNLTRFEVSLPEKRQFFVDNSDLFTSFGDQRDSNPFFSRRIGIAKDTADNDIENSIVGGVRLSGKLTKDLRLGLLNIQTEADEANEIASNNNMMLAFQQRIFSRSNIGMFFINRQATKDYDFLDAVDRYNRVLGMDFNLITADNRWTGQLYGHKSFQPGESDKDISAGSTMRFNSLNYNLYTKLVYIGEDFNSDLGFIRRTDIVKGIASVERVFWPKKGIIQNHAIQFLPIVIWKPSENFLKTDADYRGSWEARFKDTSELNFEFINRFTFLFDPFDPTDSDDAVPLEGNRGYHYNSIELGYQTDSRRIFSTAAKTTYGGFFNGKQFSVEGMMTMRFQPKAFISVLVNYDQIKLPAPYASADIWLVSPKLDITFNKSLFWSTLIQYSNQRDNLGFNSRLQWRFAPLSDLFIVYNDNYFVNSFMPRSRSINLKLTYWLNI